MTTFIDTSALIAALDYRDSHHSWSDKELRACKASGPVIISDIVYSELCAGMPDQASAHKAISNLGLEHIRHSKAALFLAAQAFKAYRGRGGPRNSLLSDILIGALPACEGKPLLTTNARDFRTHFPTLRLIRP
jgi:predicted nucleic acid-binding protein